MNKTTLIAFIFIFIFIAAFCWSQSKLSFGPELGFSFCRFPESDSSIDKFLGESQYKTTPVYAPLIGFHVQYQWKKHIRLNSGIQYLRTGTRYNREYDGYDLSDNEIVVKVEENQTFHKLSIPISVAYNLNIGKSSLAFYLGVKPNVFLTGQYYYKYLYDSTVDSRDNLMTSEYNPVNPKEADVPVRRVNSQAIIGITYGVGQNIKLSINFSSGSDVYYSEHAGMCCECLALPNRDMGFSVIYLFNGKISKEKID